MEILLVMLALIVLAPLTLALILEAVLLMAENDPMTKRIDEQMQKRIFGE